MAPTVTIDTIRRALASPALHEAHDAAHGQAAAVAAVFRADPAALDRLFLHRAEHPNDPWSGDMGWPGGRVDPRDGGPLATAVRETREELALDLERDAALVGAMPAVRTHLSAGEGPLWVAPFAFELRGAPPLVPNDEVQEALWIPMSFLLAPSNRESFVWTRRGVEIEMPCVRYEGRVIWGLTLRMLDDLVGALRAADPSS